MVVITRDLLWAGFVAVALVLRLVPRAILIRTLPFLARWLGAAWYRLDRPRAMLARSNVQTLLRHDPHSSGIATSCKAQFQNITLGMLVNAILPRLTHRDMSRFLSLEGREHLDSALGRGRGVLLLGAHFGLHSYAAVMFLQRLGYHIAIVTREGVVHEQASWFYRRVVLPVRYGFHSSMRVIPRTGTPRRELVECLRRNRIVMMMGDVLDPDLLRLRPPSVLPAPFLGHTLPLSTGPFRLARWLGAPVLPFFMEPRGSRSAIVVEPPMDLARDGSTSALSADLAAFTARLERQVRRNPALWFACRDRDLAELVGPQGPQPRIALTTTVNLPVECPSWPVQDTTSTERL